MLRALFENSTWSYGRKVTTEIKKEERASIEIIISHCHARIISSSSAPKPCCNCHTDMQHCFYELCPNWSKYSLFSFIDFNILLISCNTQAIFGTVQEYFNEDINTKWKKTEKGRDLNLVQLQNPIVILFVTYLELTAIFWGYSTCI